MKRQITALQIKSKIDVSLFSLIIALLMLLVEIKEVVLKGIQSIYWVVTNKIMKLIFHVPHYFAGAVLLSDHFKEHVSIFS